MSALRPTISVFARTLSSTTAAEVDRLLTHVTAQLAPLNVVPEFHKYTQDMLTAADIHIPPKAPQYHMCLLATGGTENLCLQYCSLIHKRQPERPLLILTHPNMNSFAAGLETKAKLLYDSRPAYLFHLPDKSEMESLFKVLRARESLVQEGKHVGIIGVPSEWLVASDLSTIGTKTDVWGIRIMEEIIDWQELLAIYKSIPDNDPEVAEIAKYYAARHVAACTSCCGGEIAEKPIRDNAKLAAALKRLAAKYGLYGLTIRCFDLIAHSITGCLAVSYMNDEGIPSACEGDIPALITMMLAHHISGKPSFMANPIHYEGKRLTLAHCTIPTKITSKYSLRTHFESGQGVAIQADVMGEGEKWTVSRANLWENDMHTEDIIMRNVVNKSEHRCRTQVEAEFSSEDALRDFVEHASGNHHILTPGAISRPLKLYKKLFVH